MRPPGRTSPQSSAARTWAACTSAVGKRPTPSGKGTAPSSPTSSVRPRPEASRRAAPELGQARGSLALSFPPQAGFAIIHYGSGATVDASEITGLSVPCVANEPTAADIAYGRPADGKDRRVEQNTSFDTGGDIFDASILHLRWVGAPGRTRQSSGTEVNATVVISLGRRGPDTQVSRCIAEFRRKHTGPLAAPAPHPTPQDPA